ncbi:hypothetical protein [Streptomyces chartreusis]|uniref:hypothetical protein n=1 Tax=Streptomyces chartreusis TaxID=1969 RepID=UPI00362805EC
MRASGRRTALLAALVWAGTCGTAVADSGSVLSWSGQEGPRVAVALAAQAEHQELTAWRARQTAAFEVAVRQAVRDAERAVTEARAAAPEEEPAPAGSDAAGVPGNAGSVASGGSSGQDWAAEIEEALDTPHPRPESSPEVDAEHQQAVEDSMTEPVAELTYAP